jgi:hypothetical protein
MKNIYEYKELKGDTLHKAIMNASYSGYNHALVDDWIEGQAEAYMEKDWDDDWKEVSTECKHCGHLPYKEERDVWAYERASDDFDCFWQDVDTGNDEEVADFFGIPDKIIGYEYEDGTEIDATDVVGECGCGCKITTDCLFMYNEILKKVYERDYNHYDEDVGLCPECDDAITIGEIQDKETKVVMSL